jgi:hypothetical protein
MKVWGPENRSDWPAILSVAPLDNIGATAERDSALLLQLDMEASLLGEAKRKMG